MTTLVTGGAGFLGRHVVAALLGRSAEARVSVLVRPREGRDTKQRVRRALAKVGCHDAELARVEVVEGDLSLPDLGLPQAESDRLADEVGQVIHGAASVRFDQGLEHARSRNVETTRNLLRFARVARVSRFGHISTCFVAGRRDGRIGEDDLEHGAGFKNTYEQSKYEAELLLRSRGSDLPISVFRPSIVVGHSATGATSSFHMIYWPIKLYARGWWRTLIARPGATVDVVPVDFVAEAIVRSMGAPEAEGKTLHLAAGPDRQSTIGELADLTRQCLQGPPVRFIDPDTFTRWFQPVVDPLLFTRRGRAIKRGGHIYLPYMTRNPSFDTSRADALLGPVGLSPPRVHEYFERLMRFAKDTDFGRRS